MIETNMQLLGFDAVVLGFGLCVLLLMKIRTKPEPKKGATRVRLTTEAWMVEVPDKDDNNQA